VRRVIAQVARRVPIVVGKSANNTQRLVEELKTFDYEGVDYILSAVPNYNKPNQEGIYQHFAAVARVVKCPILLYNVPGRTGVNMLASTTLRLAQDFTNIVGIKEAAGSLDQVSEILAQKPKDFCVLSGDDSLTLPMISVGAQGVISVIGNVLPALFGEMVHAALREEFHTAAAIHLRLHNLYKLLFEQGNPVGVKAAMASLGICENRLRLPLVPASTELARRIAEALKAL
jgi:dihydrodipicolinate synthase